MSTPAATGRGRSHFPVGTFRRGICIQVMKTRPRLSAGLTPLLVAWVASCTSAVEPPPRPLTELPRELTSAERAVIGASNAFGLALMGRVAASDERPNVILSPVSASMALGMTLNGAAGETFDAMRSTLGFGALTQEQINDSYRDLIVLLTALDPLVEFEIANALWSNQDFPFHDTFFQAVSAAFDARAASRDFADPGTLEEINAWVDQSTGGLIDSIVDALPPDLVMLLVNAIYLDAAWTLQFDPERTAPGPFVREDGTSTSVDMMELSDPELAVFLGPEYSAIELPYGSEAFSMVLVVPQAGATTRDFVAGLDAAAWDALVGSLSPTKLSLVRIPKFTLTWDGYLNEALQGMGMATAFGPAADFTRMSPLGDQLCISYVRQKTYIEVDERGTRAAAATSVGVGVTSLPPMFVVDRPFALAIRERLSGTILFIGLVGDPAADGAEATPVAADCG